MWLWYVICYALSSFELEIQLYTQLKVFFFCSAHWNYILTVWRWWEHTFFFVYPEEHLCRCVRSTLWPTWSYAFGAYYELVNLHQQGGQCHSMVSKTMVTVSNFLFSIERKDQMVFLLGTLG